MCACIDSYSAHSGASAHMHFCRTIALSAAFRRARMQGQGARCPCAGSCNRAREILAVLAGQGPIFANIIRAVRRIAPALWLPCWMPIGKRPMGLASFP
jgi:hypothetical protein